MTTYLPCLFPFHLNKEKSWCPKLKLFCAVFVLWQVQCLPRIFLFLFSLKRKKKRINRTPRNFGNIFVCAGVSSCHVTFLSINYFSWVYLSLISSLTDNILTAACRTFWMGAAFSVCTEQTVHNGWCWRCLAEPADEPGSEKKQKRESREQSQPKPCRERCGIEMFGAEGYPPKMHIHLKPQNVASFGYRVFAGVVS